MRLRALAVKEDRTLPTKAEGTIGSKTTAFIDEDKILFKPKDISTSLDIISAHSAVKKTKLK